MTLMELRYSKGFTRKELAALTGLCPATIKHIEYGWHQPHPSTLLKLAAALGISPVELTATLSKN